MIATQISKNVGSVGAVWPPRFDQHNNRVKGFYSELVDSRRKLNSMFRIVSEIEGQYPTSTRTTIRAFVRRELIEEIQKKPAEDGQLNVEAVVPAENAIPGYVIAYFGKNAIERTPDPETLKKEMTSLQQVCKIPPISMREAMARLRVKNYHITALGQNRQIRDYDVSRLLALYREAYERYTFEINERTVLEMLGNGNIVIVGKNAQSEIVSSLIAEHCTINLKDGRIVHLYELSDYATFRTHRRNGLITAMQIDAVNIIRRLHPKGDAIIYAEDRAAWEAVNISTQKAGFTYCGTLLQHCVLVSERSFGEQGIYENLHVWTI